MLGIICSGSDFIQLLYIYIELNSEVFVYFMYYFFSLESKICDHCPEQVKH